MGIEAFRIGDGWLGLAPVVLRVSREVVTGLIPGSSVRVGVCVRMSNHRLNISKNERPARTERASNAPVDVVGSREARRIASDVGVSSSLINSDVVDVHGRRKDEVLEVLLLEGWRHAKVEDNALKGGFHIRTDREHGCRGVYAANIPLAPRKSASD